MGTFIFKYNESGKLIVKANNDTKQSLIQGKSIHYLLNMMMNEEIKKIEVDYNQMKIIFPHDKVIIEDCNRFLKDKEYAYFNDHINMYQAINNELNILNAKRIVSEEKKKAALENRNVKKRANLVKTSITCALLTSMILIATINNSNSKLNEDDYGFNNNDIVIAETVNPSDNSSLYVKEHFGDKLMKYSQKYGIDFGIAKAILANNIDNNPYFEVEGHLEAVNNEYSRYVNSSVVAYNFDSNTYELYTIDLDKLINIDSYIKTINMLFQSKLRMCNYNVVAAIQWMNESDEDFKAKIVAYGKNKYPVYSQDLSATDDSIFKLVIDDLNDLNWLDMFAEEDGSIYALKVLNHISEGTTLTMKQADGEDINYKVNYSYKSNGLN